MRNDFPLNPINKLFMIGYGYASYSSAVFVQSVHNCLIKTCLIQYDDLGVAGKQEDVPDISAIGDSQGKAITARKGGP